MTTLKIRPTPGGSWEQVMLGYSSNVFMGPDPPTDPNILFWVDTDATLTSVPWTTLTLSNGWTAFAGYVVPRYRKIGDIVYLEGYAIPGTAATLGTLPVGFRPPKTVEVSCSGYTASPGRIVQSLTINNAGSVLSDSLVNVGFSTQFSVTP